MKFKFLRKPTVAAVVVGLSLTLHAFGQQPAGSGSTISADVTVMILDDGVTGLQWVGDQESGLEGLEKAELFLVSGTRSRKVEVPFGTQSRAFSYSGPREMTFYHQPVSPDPNDPKPSVAAQVQLPADADDVLLVFVTENFERQLFRILPIDLSSSDVEPNTMRITNFSGQTIAWSVESQRGMLPTRQTATIPIDKDAIRVQVQLAVFHEEADRWLRIFRRRYRPFPGERYECLLLPRSGGDVTVRFIRDKITSRQNMKEHGGYQLPVDEPPMPEPDQNEGPREAG